MVEKQPDNFRISIHRCIIEGCPTAASRDFKTSALLNKQFHNFKETFVCSSIDRCLTTFILIVDVCPMIEKQPDNFRISIHRCSIEGCLCLTIFVLTVDVCPIVEK
jgi:hypothetical protein